MKRFVTAILVFGLGLTVYAADLSEEQQRQIIQRYMYVTGQYGSNQAALSELDSAVTFPERCGTPAILDYYQNYNRLDRRTRAALGVEDQTRPTTQFEYGVPGGHTLIHYNTTGIHAIWQPTVDSDLDGVPNYIETLADIAEVSYLHIIDSLGYPLPLADSGCVNGGDNRVDIYLQALPFGFYGMTYNQSECYDPGIQQEAAWVQIDHDFQHLPDYKGRPVEAAKVTIAHELFHVIHFAIDATEHPTWFEMSAVWMEDEVYDDVNDFYLYDYVYYNHPRIGIQDTVIAGHMYQAAVWPMYVEETFGRDAIKAVWVRAGELGLGSDYLQAFDQIIDSAAASPDRAEYECLCYLDGGVTCIDSVLVEKNFATELTKFWTWNYFTGPFADMAPDGVGFSEGANFSQIPIDSMDLRVVYPFRVPLTSNNIIPQPNGAAFVRLDNLGAVPDDSLLTFYVLPDDEPVVRWGIGAIFQYADYPDSHLVVTDVVDQWETPRCDGEWLCTRRLDPADSTSICLDSVCTDLNPEPWKLRYLNEIVGGKVCLNGVFGNDLLCNPTCADSTRTIKLDEFRSVTLVVVPSALSTGPFSFGDYISFGYVSNDTSFSNPALVDLQPDILTPYPNPAVVSEMEGDGIRFRFQAQTDSTTFPVSSSAILQMDIFTVAGELVRTLEVVSTTFTEQGNVRAGGVYELEWDMTNQDGKDVASGIYLAVARLFEDSQEQALLADGRVKVAIIR